jgi:hypothetical protein
MNINYLRNFFCVTYLTTPRSAPGGSLFLSTVEGVGHRKLRAIIRVGHVKICRNFFKGMFNLVLQDLSLGKTLAASGHVPHKIFSARGGCGESIKLHQHASSGIFVKNINFANYYVQNTC